MYACVCVCNVYVCVCVLTSRTSSMRVRACVSVWLFISSHRTAFALCVLSARARIHAFAPIPTFLFSLYALWSRPKVKGNKCSLI